jgi:hypothetical protein
MHGSGISIWFFIGVLLLSYGVLILGYGIYEALVGPLAAVELATLHTPIWWGAILLAAGLLYVIKFNPAKAAK